MTDRGYGKQHRIIRKGFRKGLRRSIEDAQIGFLEVECARQERRYKEQRQLQRARLDVALARLRLSFARERLTVARALVALKRWRDAA